MVRHSPRTRLASPNRSCASARAASGREPESGQLFFAHGEMERQLVVDVALDRAAADREAKETTPARSRTHANSGDVRRSATAIASACRCHSGAWARKRARPAAVSL